MRKLKQKNKDRCDLNLNSTQARGDGGPGQPLCPHGRRGYAQARIRAWIPTSRKAKAYSSATETHPQARWPSLHHAFPVGLFRSHGAPRLFTRNPQARNCHVGFVRDQSPTCSNGFRPDSFPSLTMSSKTAFLTS